MSEQEDNSFSWQSLFFVTGISGFGFDLVLWKLDGYHTPVILWIGIIGTSLGILSLLLKYIARAVADKDEA